MKKDFSTIKEMANKKLLTGEEKKVLSKLYESKIEIRKTQIRNEQDVEYEKAKTNALNKIKANSKIKKALADIDLADKMIENAEKLLDDNGLDYKSNYSDSKRNLVIETNRYGNKNETLKEIKELNELKENQSERLYKMSHLDTDIKLALYLPTMTRGDIDEMLETELSKI